MPSSALRFTASGVVAAPETVQIRVAPGFRGRVTLGAPVPSRAMTPEEVVANATWFRSPGPRDRPVQRVVLSGVPPAWLAEGTLGVQVAALRDLGVPQVVLHLEPNAVAAAPQGVSVAVAIRSAADAAALGVGRPLRVTVPLAASVLGALGPLLRALHAVPLEGLTLLWPFPSGAEAPPPSASAVVAALRGAADALAPLPWGVKGLPLCTLLPLEGIVPVRGKIWRSANRFFVDADHQKAAALLLMPDLLTLTKADACRFCKVDHRCDGVAALWLDRGLTGGLSPVEDGQVP